MRVGRRATGGLETKKETRLGMDQPARHTRLKVVIATGFALLAFSANSILCRMALRDQSIDPVSFTGIRIAAGALTLSALSIVAHRRLFFKGNWTGAWFLALYAFLFSWAYVDLAAGTGALLLFGAVQVVMMAAGFRSGETISARKALGWLIAAAGTALLVAPSVSTPQWLPALLMVGAGAAWGLYSIGGRHSRNPLAENAGNFLRVLPLAAILLVLARHTVHLESRGIWLAVASGSVASGMGYAAWYTALPHWRAITAANLQLAVPALTAALGVMLFSEIVTMRLVVATVLIFGGIALATSATLGARSRD